MKLVVVGIGYVGLVTASVFADLGNQVWGLDIDKEKIEKLKKGKLPFYEPGLKELLQKNLQANRLQFTTSYKKALTAAEIIFICVGTPARKNGDYNLDYVFQAAKSIGRHLNDYALVVIKSTVPPGTNEQVKEVMEQITKTPFDLASCPEFLREGSAVQDAFQPSRIIIGVDNDRSAKLLKLLHRPIKSLKMICDPKSAQIIKYAANAFLSTKISFINLIARLCDKTNADIVKVSEGLGLDPRISKEFLKAGLGYGGSCFPKDTWALASFAKKQSVDFGFLSAVNKINRNQIDYFVEKISRLAGGDLKDKTIAVLGLSFKPDTDDIREARSILLIKKLQRLGAKIKAYDPVAMANAKQILKKIKYVKDPYQAVKNADVLVLVTEWKEFKNLKFTKIKSLMRQPIIVDGRNFYNPEKLKKLGFIYEGVGRK